MDERHAAELQGLVERAARARRLARDTTDPSVRRSFLDWALQSEARIAKIVGTESTDHTPR